MRTLEFEISRCNIGVEENHEGRNTMVYEIIRYTSEGKGTTEVKKEIM